MSTAASQRALIAPDEALRARERARKFADREHASQNDWSAGAGRWVAENPAVALGVAAGLGFLIGWWLKR